MTDIAVRPKPLSHNNTPSEDEHNSPDNPSSALGRVDFENNNPSIPINKAQPVPLDANSAKQQNSKIKREDAGGSGDDHGTRNAVADAMTSLSTPAPTPIAPSPAQPILIAPAPVKAPAMGNVYYSYQPGMAPAAAPAASPGGSSNGVPPTPLGPGQPLRGEYRDASLLLDPPPDARRNRGGVTEPFPEKLHRMLSDVERDALTDVVSFFSHGRAFAIHKPRRFVQEIMPHYFRQTRLTSFQRQLNLYGFQRISQGPDNGGYYHELFLRGRPGLCVNMKRTKVKGTTKSKRDPDTEPNFYAMPMPVSAGMLPFPPNYQAPSPAPAPTSSNTPAPAAPTPAAPAAFYPSPYANTPAGATPIFPYPPCPPLPFSAAPQGQANTPAGYVYPHQMYVMPQTFSPWITAAAGTGVSPMVAAQQPNAAGAAAVTAASAAPANPNQPSPMAVAQQNAPVLIASGGGGYTGASERGATPMMAAQAKDGKDEDGKEEETTPV